MRKPACAGFSCLAWIRRGGQPYAPEILLGLLFYAYATGAFSSRKIEQGTKETAAFRSLAGNLSPDYDAIAAFRKNFLPEISGRCVQILSLAQETGLLPLGNISRDGTKIHADASENKAVSYKRLLAIEAKLQAEVVELFALAQTADSRASNASPKRKPFWKPAPPRKPRASRRSATPKCRRGRLKKSRQAGNRVANRPPRRLLLPQNGDQYNFTDPDIRVMKNSRDGGFSPQHNAQAIVDHDALLIVGGSLSTHANDQGEVAPTLETLPQEPGQPSAATLDTGYFSETNRRV